MGSLYTMWLSELGTFEMFWDLKIYSITETGTLWYDLHGYVCYCSWDLSKSSLWPHDCLCPVLWTICYAWPMTSPLQIIMIMHELQNELKTSVNWACWCSPCSSDPTVDNMARGVASTRRKLSEKLSSLLSLARYGSYDCLEEGGLVGPNMGT
mgnify:CR=1 FL=1